MKRSHLWLLPLTGFLIGLSLRLFRLTALPPWTDECATIAFSLGNSFLGVPLNAIISADVLLEPLQLRSDAVPGDVVRHLMAESTHPPLYFLLSHFWMKLWGADKVLWSARSLSAILGALTVPAMYFWAKRTFHSPKIARFAAGLMALSPFAVFLSQEARHYTLAILLAIASLYCCTVAIEALTERRRLPKRWICTWILVNGVGIAVHYFFGFVPLIQGLVFAGYWLLGSPPRRDLAWRGVGVAALGTAVAGAVWIPVWRRFAGSDLTDWVSDGGGGFDALGRTLAWLVSMLVMLPLDVLGLPIWAIALSGILLLGAIVLWFRVLFLSKNCHTNSILKKRDLVRKNSENLKTILLFGKNLVYLYSKNNQHTDKSSFRSNSNTQKNSGFKNTKILSKNINIALSNLSFINLYLIISISIFLIITYLFGKDLTLAPRFFFPILPVFILFAAYHLKQTPHLNPQKLGILTILALLGSISVTFNLSYLQNHRGDRLAQFIAQTSDVPIIITTTHKHHGQTGRLQAIAWELNQLQFPQPTRYLLAHKAPDLNPTQTVEDAISQLSRPFDLWTTNFHAAEISDDLNCEEADEDDFPDINGYRYDLFRCR